MYTIAYRLLSLALLFVLAISLTAQALEQQSAADTSHAGQDTTLQAVEQTSSESKTTLREAIKESAPDWSLDFSKIFWSLIVLGVGYVVIWYLTRLVERLAEYWLNMRLVIRRLIPILRIVGWISISYIIIADILQPPIATLVAVTASAGIAVGFASQDILKNIFGGFVILFDRPFQVGDKIEVGNHYGEVVSIGLRTVRIVTPDDSLVAIPNSEIVSQSVSNANSGETNCQVVAEFYLPPNVDLVAAKRIAHRAAAVSRYIYLNKPISVVIKNEIYQGRSLIKMRLKAYVLDIRFEFPFASEMTEIVIKELLKYELVTPQELAWITPRDHS